MLVAAMATGMVLSLSQQRRKKPYRPLFRFLCGNNLFHELYL